MPDPSFQFTLKRMGDNRAQPQDKASKEQREQEAAGCRGEDVPPGVLSLSTCGWTRSFFLRCHMEAGQEVTLRTFITLHGWREAT